MKKLATVKQFNNRRTTKPIDFPNEVMSGMAGRYAITMGQHLETPPSFLYMSALTMLGTIISFKVTLHSPIKPQPRLFTVLLGETADTRKSTSINLTTKLFQNTIQPCPWHWICTGVNSAEGLIMRLAESPVLLLCVDEFTHLISKMKQGPGTLLPTINMLFHQNQCEITTKKESIMLDDVYLSMLTASTLETYEGMFTEKFDAIGFMNRLFIVVDKGKKKFSVPPPISLNVQEGLQNDLLETLKFVADLAGPGADVYHMSMTPAAHELFDHWYHSDKPNSHFARRLDSYGHRLMPLLAVNEGKAKVDEDIVNKTITLLNYQLKVREYAAPIDAFNQMAKLEEKIRRALKEHGSMTNRELYKKLHGERWGTRLWKNTLKLMMESGEITNSYKQYSLVPEDE